MHGDEDLPTGHHPVTGAHHHEDVGGGIVAAVLPILARRSVVVHGGIVEAPGSDPRDLDSRAFRRQRRVDTETPGTENRHMTTTEHRNEALDRLALGSRCHRCGAGTDEPCTTPAGVSTLPHTARVDRAARQYLKATGR